MDIKKKKTTETAAAQAAKPKAEKARGNFALGRENYIIMLIGLGVIFLGFILMIGGGSEDPNVFSDAIYNFQRLTLAPILVLAGYVIEIYAIMKKPRAEE